MRKISLFHLWIVYVALIFVGAISVNLIGFKINTDFLSIFPKYSERGEFYKANALYEANFENEFLIFISAANKDAAVKGADSLSAKMKVNDLFSEVKVQFSSQRSLHDLAPFLYEKRKALLTSKQISLIQDGKTEIFVDQALASLYSPTGSAAQLKTDPLGLFQEYYLNASGSFVVKPYQGYLISEINSKSAVLIRSKLNKDAKEFNSRLIDFFETEKKKYAFRDMEMNAVGALLFSAFGSEKSMDEVGVYGAISMVAIVALLLGCFSSLTPMIASALTILVSVISGLVVVMVIYGSVHILSILLGISVLGIVTDYCTHFFAKAFDESLNNSEEVIKKIKGALGIGFLTNMLTYLCFYFTDLLVLKQLSIFTMIGILTTYITVLAVYPKLEFKKIKAYRLLKVIGWSKIWNKVSVPKSIITICCVVAIGLLLTGGFKFNDDVKLLQSINPVLKDDETKVFNYLGASKSPFYFILKGSSPEDLLIKEEALSEKLSAKSFKSVSLSKLVPSLERQDLSLKAYSDLRGPVVDFYHKIKFSDSKAVVDQMFEVRQSPLLVQDFLLKAENLPLSINWLGQIQDSFYSVVNVFGASSFAELEGFQDSSIHLVSKVHDLNQFLRSLREAIIGKFALVFLVLLTVLVYLFRLKKALLILFAPTVSALATLVITLLISGHLNLFNVLAVILIFCLGMDYSVFFSQKEDSKIATHIGVFISFISTISSFGVLAMSSTFAVSSFGLSVLIGICLCYFLSPLSAGGESG